MDPFIINVYQISPYIRGLYGRLGCLVPYSSRDVIGSISLWIVRGRMTFTGLYGSRDAWVPHVSEGFGSLVVTKY